MPRPRKNSRQKGKTGELDLRDQLRKFGYADARRGQQYSGTETSADVVCAGLAEFHIECKRTEGGNLYKWMEQAMRDAAGKKTPVVMHKRNQREWVAILRLEDFLALTLLRGAA